MVERTVLLALVAMLVFGCQSSDELLIQKVERQLRLTMKDPDSAKFEDVRVIKGSVVCGSVNGKNEYGGYVGFKPFVGTTKNGDISITLVEERLPIFMTTDYPAEELGECFPQLVPALRTIIGEDFMRDQSANK